MSSSTANRGKQQRLINQRKQSSAQKSDSSNENGSGQLNLLDVYDPPAVILHRSANRVVTQGDHKLYEPTKDKDHEFRGWKAPVHMPYKPLGTFQKVIPVIEQMKVIVRNSKEMQAETQKNIGKAKRNKDSIYRFADNPKRAWEIMSRGVADMRTRSDRSIDEVLRQQKLAQNRSKNNRGQAQSVGSKKMAGYQINPSNKFIDLREVAAQDSNGLMRRMHNLEKNFHEIPLGTLDKFGPFADRVHLAPGVKPNVEEQDNGSHDGDGSKDEYLDDCDGGNITRLMTPRMKKMSQRKDASVMLKEEIGESTLRLKAAKFGRPIEDLAPSYPNSYYLPKKEDYKTPQQRQRQELGLNNTKQATISKSQSGGNGLQSRNNKSVFKTQAQMIPFDNDFKINSAASVHRQQNDSVFMTSMIEPAVSPHLGRSETPLNLIEAQQLKEQNLPQIPDNKGGRNQQQSRSVFQSSQYTRNQTTAVTYVDSFGNRMNATAFSNFQNGGAMMEPGPPKTSLSFMTKGTTPSIGYRRNQQHTPQSTQHPHNFNNSVNEEGFMRMQMHLQQNQQNPQFSKTNLEFNQSQRTASVMHQRPFSNEDLISHWNKSVQNNSSNANRNAKKVAEKQIQKLKPKRPEHLNNLRNKYEDKYGKFEINTNKVDTQEPTDTQTDGNLTDRTTQPHQSNGPVSIQQDIRFLSAIDCRPIDPPFLQLSSFEDFLKQQKDNSENLLQANFAKKKKTKADRERMAISQIEKSEYDETIRKRGIYRFLDEKLSYIVADSERKYEQIKERKSALNRKLSIVKSIGRKPTRANPDGDTSSDFDDDTNHYDSTQIESPNKSPLKSTMKNKKSNMNVTQSMMPANGSQSQQTNKTLTRHQNHLLNKLIAFDSIQWTEKLQNTKSNLYNLFFVWRSSLGINLNDSENEDGQGGQGTKNEQEDKQNKAAEEREERKKRIQLKKDQELLEFQDKGGFVSVLNDIFNPTNINSLELDSVFQLKKLCRDFYKRKSDISFNLISSLDAMSNERPQVLSTKKRNFDIAAGHENCLQAARKETSLDWMRIKAEKARIAKFKSVVKISAGHYYKLLDAYSKLIVSFKEGQQQKVDQLVKAGREIDHVLMMEQEHQDQQLKQTLLFVTDFMKQVVENGNVFSKNHFFLMLLHLSSEEVQNGGAPIFSPFVDLLEIRENEFHDFVRGMDAPDSQKLQEVYRSVQRDLFNKNGGGSSMLDVNTSNGLNSNGMIVQQQNDVIQQ